MLAIDEANSSIMGCYSDLGRFGTTYFEYPCLDDSVQYCNMYDVLLRKNLAHERNLIEPE